MKTISKDHQATLALSSQKDWRDQIFLLSGIKCVCMCLILSTMAQEYVIKFLRNR